MALERRRGSDLAGPSLATVVVVGGLAVLGAILLVQWVLGFLAGLVKLAIVVAIVAAVLSALAGAFRRR